MFKLCYIWHVSYLSFVYMLASHCTWHTHVTLPYIPMLHCIGYMLCIVYGIHTLLYVWFGVSTQTWEMRDVHTWSDEPYLNPRSPTLLIQHDRVCSIHLFCCIHSYWFAHLTSLASMHRNTWLVAQGLRTILPWVHSMIGRVVVHTFGLQIPCHALSVLCCSKTSVL